MMKQEYAFVEVTDLNGARHILRVQDIQSVTDSDPMRNETVIVVRNKPILVQKSLDDFRKIMFPDKGQGRKTLH